MLTLHHLGIAQSERIIWLLEELEIPYKLVLHRRDPITSPDSLKNIPGNRSGRAPFLEDPDAGITLCESGAICDYINYRYGDGRLALKPSDKNYAEYLYWFHFANATLQPEALISMFLGAQDGDPNSMIKGFSRQRMAAAWQQLDDRLKDNKWLAGEQFTAADIMTVYTCTTQRYFGPLDDLSKYTNLLRWLKDVSERPAYQRAMEKGDPEMKILNSAKPPSVDMMSAGGANSGHWKK